METNGKFKGELAHFIANARYDFQEVRKSTMNRLRGVLVSNIEGWGYSVPKTKEDEEKSFGKEWTDERIEEKIQLALIEKKITEDEFEFLQKIREAAAKFEKEEKEYEKLFAPFCDKWSVWSKWLSRIRGIGRVHALNLYQLNCANFPTISKLWAYCGYHVVDGQAPKRKSGEKVNWNMYARSRVWNIAKSLIRTKGKGYGLYLKFKEEVRAKHPIPICMTCGGEVKQKGLSWRCINDKENKRTHLLKWTPAHVDAYAIRKLAKVFLSCYWRVARQEAGLPISQPYIIGKGEHEHIIEPRDFVDDV